MTGTTYYPVIPLPGTEWTVGEWLIILDVMPPQVRELRVRSQGSEKAGFIQGEAVVCLRYRRAIMLVVAEVDPLSGVAQCEVIRDNR